MPRLVRERREAPDAAALRRRDRPPSGPAGHGGRRSRWPRPPRLPSSGSNLVRADDQVSHLQHTVGTAAPTAVAAALQHPGPQGRQPGERRSPAVGPVRARARRPGLSGLVGTARRCRPGGPTSCGAIVGGKPISLGLLGPSPSRRPSPGRASPAVPAGHHRRAGRWVGGAQRPDGRHGDGLSRCLLASRLMPEDAAEKKRRPIEVGAEAEPVKLGSMLFTLVEPRRGHEVAYNRWYERDHFYAGCMVGPYNFAGRRFVATAELKACATRTRRSSPASRTAARTWRCTGCSTATTTCGTAGPCDR